MSAIGRVLVGLLEDNLHSVGAEIGAHSGDTANYICKNFGDMNTYYAYDTWKREERDGVLYRKPPHYKYFNIKAARKNLKKVTEPYQNIIKYYFMSSEAAAKRTRNESLNWVLIKGSSHYEEVFKNIRLWMMKVKTNGMVLGINYHKKGVKKALNDFVPKEKLTHFSNGIWFFERGKF